jgi:RNA polymerase sigma factor (sigma-70 family)
MVNTPVDVDIADRITTDHELLESYVTSRDESAFASLVDRHGGTVWRLCRRIVQKEHDAEDAYQAVFIVLSRKASSIRRGEAIGSWLYRVAYRIAMKVRMSLQRRQKVEGASADVAREDPPCSAAALNEMQRILDEEVDRLDEKFRAPFVLCCLEGLSKPEAARELGWPEPTIKARFAHAKKLLQARLVRRGITLSAVLTAVALVQNTASAAPVVLAVTVSSGAIPSAPALALAESFVSGMASIKLKASIAVLLAASLIFTGAMVVPFFAGSEALEQEPSKRIDFGNDPALFVAPPAPVIQAHDEQVLAIAFSPDGKRLVTAGGRHTLPGQLMIWDVEKHKELVRIRGMRGIRGVAFSPDGKTIACGSFGGAIQLRDADTGKECTVLEGHTFGVNAVVYSADGNMLASAGLDHSVKLWDVHTATAKKTFVGHSEMVFSVALFRHGKTIVTGGQDRTAKIWDVETGKVKFDLTGHAGAVEAVAVSPDDKSVATASWDGTIKLWDAETGKEQAVLRGEVAVYAVAFSSDGALLASASSDGSTRIWDAKTRKMIKRLEGHGTAVWCIAFTPDHKVLATGSSDRTAKLWNVETGKEIATLPTAELKRVHAAVYAPDGQSIVVAGDDMNVQVRDAKSGHVRRVLAGHTKLVNCIVISPDGATLASGSSDTTIKLWNLATGHVKRTLNGHAGAVLALAFAKDGKLASAGEDKLVKWWDLTDGNETITLKGHTDVVRALAFAPNGLTLASAGSDHVIRIWTLGDPTKSRILTGHTASVRTLAFGREGLLASADDSGLIRLWNPVADKGQRTLHGHSGPIHSLAFTSGERTLVSGGADKTIVVWDPVTLQRRITLRGHKGSVTALTIHPQDDHLVSASDDTTLMRWQSAMSATPARVLKSKSGSVTFAQVSTANDRLATGSADGSVTLWARSLVPAIVPYPSLEGVFWGADFAPDGRTMAVARESNVQILNVSTGSVVHTLPMGKPVRSVKFSADKKYLAVTTGSTKAPDAPNEATLFDTATWKELARMDGHKGIVVCAAFSPDGKTLATLGADRTTKLWQIPTGELRATLETRFALAKGLLFLPDGTLVTASWDKTIRFWHIESKTEKKKWDVGLAMTTLAISPDGSLLAAAEHPSPGTGPAELKIWNVTTGRVVLEPKGHTGRILALAFTPDGRGLVASGGKLNHFGEILYWDVATGGMRGVHKTPNQWMENVLVSPDGRRIASTSSSALRFWDLDFLHNERTWNAHIGAVSSGVFANGGTTLVTAGQDKSIKSWDTRDAHLVATLDGHTAPIHALTMLPDGKTIASAGEDCNVKLWDLADAKEKATLEGHTKSVFALAASPDGKTLASGSEAGAAGSAELILWNLHTLKPHRSFSEHERTVQALAYSPDGSWLAIAAAQDHVCVLSTHDDTEKTRLKLAKPRAMAFSPNGKLLAVGEGNAPANARLFDTTTWKERPSLEKHRNAITSVGFSPDGQRIVSASQDGVIRLNPNPAHSASMVAIPAEKSDPVPQAETSLNLHVPLKGLPTNLPKMKLVGADAAKSVAFEPDGMRITLPPGFEGSRPQVGLSTGIVLKGDFEVTVAFEIFKMPDPAEAGSDTPLALWLWSLKGERFVTGVSRRMVVNDGPQFVAFAATIDRLNITTHTMGQTVPAAAKSGHLRLVRIGREFWYFVSEGPAAEFKLLHRYTISDQDMDDVRLIASTCDPRGSLDARFSDLRIRTGNALRAPVIPDDVAAPTGPAIPTADSMVWLTAVAGLALVFAVLAGVALFIRVRRTRSKTPSTSPVVHMPAKPESLVTFSCTCGKRLKAKVGLAGRKLKCPQCGTALSVPSPTSSG